MEVPVVFVMLLLVFLLGIPDNPSSHVSLYNFHARRKSLIRGIRLRFDVDEDESGGSP
jgi:hypothetical protein